MPAIRSKISSCRKTGRHFSAAVTLILFYLATNPSPSFANPKPPGIEKQISIKQIPSPEGLGFGYQLTYYINQPIDVVWNFKTDFDSDIMLSSDELIGHRLVEVDGNDVITENRYASAPGLRFLWKTTVLSNRYRLDFKLLNPEDCRHDFHYGSINLIAAGGATKIVQTAFFDFTGASLWVKYPWYGGMRSTLTQVAKWEQRTVDEYRQTYVAAVDN